MTLYEQAERMRQLVEQLRDLSRVDAATLRIEPQRISLREHLERIVAIAAAENRGAIRVEAPEGVEVVVDPVAVERIVANLVVNALRYGAPPVVVTGAQTDQHVRISVQDSGEGVAADFVPYLFQRFRRSPESLTKGPGTGLGLAIARSYARTRWRPLLPTGRRGRTIRARGSGRAGQRLTPTQRKPIG